MGDANLNELGRLLRQARQKHKLRQIEAAARLNINQGYLSQLENGKKTPLRSTLQKIIESYDIVGSQADELLLAAGYAPDQQFDLDRPSVRKLSTALNNPELRQEYKEQIERDVLSLIEAWEKYALAKQQQYRREWVEAIGLIDTVHEIIVPVIGRLQAYALDTKATARLHQGNIEIAETLYKQATALAKDAGDPNLEGIILAHQGDIHREKNNWPQARSKYDEAEIIFKRHSNTQKEAWVQRKRAMIDLFRGEWVTAKEALDRCLAVFKEVGDTYELAKTLYALGWAYYFTGDWDTGYQRRCEGFKIARSYKVEGRWEDSYLIMLGYTYLADFCRETGDYDEAIEKYDRALAISDTIRDKKERGYILLQRARAFHLQGMSRLEQNNEEEASDSFRRAEEGFESAKKVHYEIGHHLRLAVTQIHLSSFYLDQEVPAKWGLAEAELESAKDLCRRVGSYYYESAALVQLAEAYRRRRKYEKIPALVHDVANLPHSYPMHQAKLAAVRARAALHEQRQSDADKLYADAFFHAVSFNEHIVREIAEQFDDAIREVRSSLGSEAAVQLYHNVSQQLLQRIEEEQKRDPQYLHLQRRDQIDRLMESLRKKERCIQRQQPISNA